MLDKKFEEILNNYREDDYPHETLYHYTTASALLAMLESKEFWLTDYRYLNDPSEIAYAVDQILNQINKLRDRHQLMKLEPSFSDLVRESIIKYYNFYVFSLCKYENYLPAWRWYGNNGAGLAIGFRPDFLPKNDGLQPIYLKCCYEESEYKSFLEKLLLENEKSGPKLENLVYCLMHLMPKIKHHGYKEEHEYRLCILEEKEEIQGTIVHVPSENRLWRDGRSTSTLYVDTIPTIKWPFKKESLCEIWVGPRCNYEHAKHELEKILNKFNFVNVKINKSEIPYRL